MNTALLQILTGTAIEKIAEVHGTSTNDVKTALHAGQEVVCREFCKLILAGCRTVEVDPQPIIDKI